MPRRYATSAPPSGSSQSSHHHRRQHHSRRRHDTDPGFREKEVGFDWTPSIIIALLGTLTYLNRDFDKQVRFEDKEHDDEPRRRKKSSSRSAVDESSGSDKSMSPLPSQGRKRRGRSKGPKESDKEGIERYYEYGPKPGKAATCEDCDDDGDD